MSLLAKLFPALEEVIWSHISWLEELVDGDRQLEGQVLQASTISKEQTNTQALGLNIFLLSMQKFPLLADRSGLPIRHWRQMLKAHGLQGFHKIGKKIYFNIAILKLIITITSTINLSGKQWPINIITNDNER